MGQALVEQHQIDEKKDQVKYYQLRELADQNETSARTERAIQQGDNKSAITEAAVMVAVVVDLVWLETL